MLALDDKTDLWRFKPVDLWPTVRLLVLIRLSNVGAGVTSHPPDWRLSPFEMRISESSYFGSVSCMTHERPVEG